MKKMNLNFTFRDSHRMKLGRGLVLFAILFLFGFGMNSISAQYVSKQVAFDNLTKANIKIMENWESIQQSGDQVAIERAKLKQAYLRMFIQELKKGSTVAEVVDKYIADDNDVIVYDYQLGAPNKDGDDTGWLKDEILEMLEL